MTAVDSSPDRSVPALLGGNEREAMYVFNDHVRAAGTTRRA